MGEHSSKQLGPQPGDASTEKLYHYIGELILLQQVKHLNASVYVYSTEGIERATIRASNISKDLSQSILIELGAANAPGNPYAQTFQSLREWVKTDTPGIYSMVIHAANPPASNQARKYNSLELSGVVSIILNEEDEEVDSKDIALHEIGAFN